MIQEVKIDLYDEESNHMGTLTIACNDPKLNQKSDIIYPEENIQLKNVEIVEEPDDSTYIQYCINQNHSFNNIMLLEETTYDVLFESNKSKGNFIVLDSLNNSELSIKPFKQMNFNLSDENVFKCVGTLNFKAYVGKSFLSIKEGNISSISIPIEIRSKKINYFKQYPAMISDLSEYSSGMLFDLKAPLSQLFKIDQTSTRTTLYEDYMYLEYLFDDKNLPTTMEYLLRNMNSQLIKNKEIVPSSQAGNISPKELINLLTSPDKWIKNKNSKLNNIKEFKGYIPEYVEEIKYEDTIDTNENRFVKYFLQQINDLIEDLINTNPKGYIYDNLQKFSQINEYYLQNRIFKDISTLNYLPTNSQILQKKEGYNEILNYFLMLEFSFKLNWSEVTNEFKGYEKRLSQLYEYWCYFKVLEVLNDLSINKINFDDIFEIDQNKWSIKLKRSNKSKKTFKILFKEKIVTIDYYYNQLFKRNSNYKSYSLSFKPDYTLLIKTDNEKYFIHFDAKYKSELEIKDFYEKIKLEDNNNEKLIDERDAEEEIFHKFKDGDIYKMHTYKDAILNTEGAYVLYPGEREGLFMENRKYVIPSVGAFPLTPGNDQNEHIQLKLFIKNILNQLLIEKNILK